MTSPVPKIYPLGSRLLFKLACTAPSGLGSCRATSGGPGTVRRNVVPGSRFTPAKTGSYRCASPPETATGLSHDDLAVPGRARHHLVQQQSRP